MKSVFGFFFLLLSITGWSRHYDEAEYKQIKLRLFSTKQKTQAQVKIKRGGFHLIAYTAKKNLLDTITYLDATSSHQLLSVGNKDNRVYAKLKGKNLGTHQVLKIVPAQANSVFVLKYGDKERPYDGILWLENTPNHLLPIGEFDLEEYVAGVVEAEAGHVPDIEFLKVQAVLARSYAIKNFYQHLEFGYNLKDDVSSQVFHGRARHKHSEHIRDAVEQTKKIVLKDKKKQVAQTVFHANSGGVTANAHEVWNAIVPYLKSKKDPYSLGQKKTQWEKKITYLEYIKFFEKKYPELYTHLLRSDRMKQLVDVAQKTRKPNFKVDGMAVSYVEMRKFFKLRSAYFNIEKQGDHVLLSGKGYGHGIGLSQEGAINMARKKFNFKQIIDFYYTGLTLSEL